KNHFQQNISLVIKVFQTKKPHEMTRVLSWVVGSPQRGGAPPIQRRADSPRSPWARVSGRGIDRPCSRHIGPFYLGFWSFFRTWGTRFGRLAWKGPRSKNRYPRRRG